VADRRLDRRGLAEPEQLTNDVAANAAAVTAELTVPSAR